MRTKKRTKSIVGIIFAFVSILYAFTGAVFALRRDNSSRKGLSGRIDVNLTAGKASAAEIADMSEYDGRKYGIVTPVKS